MSIEILLERKVDNFLKDYPAFKDKEINKRFLFFSVHHLLKNSTVAYEDILEGLIDGSNDYGIDAVFIFSSGELVLADDDLSQKIAKEDKIRIQLIQACRDGGFGENALLKIRNGIEEMFDLKVTEVKGSEEYKQKAALVRRVWERCFDLASVENIDIEILYVTLSTTESANKKVRAIEGKIIDYLRKQGLKNVKEALMDYNVMKNDELDRCISRNLLNEIFKINQNPSQNAK